MKNRYLVLSWAFHHTRIFGNIASYDREYYSKKLRNSETIIKVNLKCDIVNCCIQNGLRQPILFSFGLDKPYGYIIFCQPQSVR